ncbi:hypothetical protein REPUB_Repub11eG0132100 [Reevesia pubescens]
MGIGVDIRNYEGEVLALLSRKILMPADPFTAKCLALKESLRFALDIGIYEIEVEGDSSLVISAIKGNMEDHSLAGGIVELVKKSLQKFRSVRLLHVKRSGNVMAHVLAKHAKKIDTFHVWIEEVPSFLSDVFLKDSSMAISNSVPLSSQ